MNNISQDKNKINRKEIKILEIPELHEKSKAVLKVIAEADADIYQNYSGLLVRLKRRGDFLKTDVIDKYSLRNEISKYVKCVKKTEFKGNVFYSEIHPPFEVVQSALSLTDSPIPILNNIVSHPVVAHNGNISKIKGYDKDLCLYIDTTDEIINEINNISDAPTDNDIEAAISNLWDVVQDFKFKNDGSKAAFFAAMLTMICKPMIKGNVPIFLIKASTPGTGKTLLLNCIIKIITGKVATMTSWADTEEELKKSLFSMLLENREYICFDNINVKIKSATLAGITTSEVFNSRILGLSKQVDVLNNSIFFITANNPDISTEIARRCVPIELTTDKENPETRNNFKYSDLLQMVDDNRGKLIKSLFVMVKAWIARGRDVEGVRMMGSFSSWSSTIGGILKTIGTKSFLSNHADFITSTDSDKELWRPFIIAWYNRHGGNIVEVKQLLDIAKQTMLTDAIKTDQSQIKSLGRMIAKRDGQVISGYQITAGTLLNGIKRWRLVSVNG